MKKPAVVYMVNLASADLLLVSVLPFEIFYYFRGQNWPFGPEMCRFLTSTFFCNTFCSIMLMTAISVDRCLAVLYPMQSLSWLTVRRASLVCAAIWLVAIAGVIYFMTTELTLKIPQLNITICADALDVSVVLKSHRYYAFVLSILFFCIPLFMSTVCYVSIIRKLSSSDIATNRGETSHKLESRRKLPLYTRLHILFGGLNIQILNSMWSKHIVSIPIGLVHILTLQDFCHPSS
ncbi:hypothetical protein JRQ81_013809 [Phrynocephalus forsythii]|uniref:G-protein coupled receptors family 1 profile domain-containing protein n=1 Tax=Phrynocephalus forsythii TaxID=171643 RepID=A0A9Q1B4D8_9SAUR|nr:hypothetical protein JRQ81_013809 [Phrynocephalus forsythii]